MNCPVCNRNNAFNLSICPSCGAMMNDSVRAELLNKISVSKRLKMETEKKDDSAISGKLNLPPAAVKENAVQPEITLDAAPPAPKQTTSDLTAKATSKTLVEFHSKNSAVPEWRVQLQNAVHKRNNRESQPTEPIAAASPAPRKTKLATSGANALKTEIVREPKPSARPKNPALASALERIEKSRRQFLVEVEEQPEETVIEPIAAAQPRPASKNFPFYIASKQGETPAKPIEMNAPAVVVENPKPAAAPPRNESGDLDTNKLIAPPAAKISSSFAKPPVNALIVETKTSGQMRIEPKVERKQVEAQSIEPEQIARVEESHDEFEDLAPFSMRFNSGLFDLIIGGFVSLFLLAPFMMTGGDWFTFTGLLAFLATCSIVMFVYLTATVGFYGRTFGMRLFSLEVVDADGESYPTLHQSAVSSAVYLLSLAFGGVGFLTLLFNDEKRAAHDLISGTIVVREN